jgi:hypothetical protein
MIELNRLFDIEYGNQADLNKLEQTSSAEGIRFISRSSENLGFQCYVKKTEKLKIYKKGLITVTLGGTYVLSSFVQPDDFYTGQNIKVLSPKVPMSDVQKYFYCFAIASNRFRYTSHGREANKTLDNILVPDIDEIPKWVYEDLKVTHPSTKPIHEKLVSLNDRKWKLFEIEKLFYIKGSKTTPQRQLKGFGIGKYPYVTTQASNNGIEGFYDFYTEKGNVLTIDSAVIGYCSYQFLPFSASDHVELLIPKFQMNAYIALFLMTILNKEQYRYSYGRKASQTRLKLSKIKLPSTNKSDPDWQFMEYYIKSLPYSSNIENMFKDNKELTDKELIEKYDTGKKVDFDKKLKQMSKTPSPTTLSKLKK